VLGLVAVAMAEDEDVVVFNPPVTVTAVVAVVTALIGALELAVAGTWETATMAVFAETFVNVVPGTVAELTYVAPGTEVLLTAAMPTCFVFVGDDVAVVDTVAAGTPPETGQTVV
jgi:hypothetical protein